MPKDDVMYVKRFERESKFYFHFYPTEFLQKSV